MRCRFTIDMIRGHSDERWRQSEEYWDGIRRAVRRAMAKSTSKRSEDMESEAEPIQEALISHKTEGAV